MSIYDEDYYNNVKAEERQYEAWQIKEKNRIFRLMDSRKKQQEWNKLYPKIALEGLSQEELTRPY